MFKRALVMTAAAAFVALGLAAAPAAAENHSSAVPGEIQSSSAEGISANKNIWM
jgi:hypothetical protein